MRDYFNFNVHLAMNITDIDDKIIKKAIEQDVKFDVIAKKFEHEFLEDMESLNVEMPDNLTRVSEYMDEIVAFIKKIIENGYAYESNGSVYFDVPKFAKNPNH